MKGLSQNPRKPCVTSSPSKLKAVPSFSHEPSNTPRRVHRSHLNPQSASLLTSLGWHLGDTHHLLRESNETSQTPNGVPLVMLQPGYFHKQHSTILTHENTTPQGTSIYPNNDNEMSPYPEASSYVHPDVSEYDSKPAAQDTSPLMCMN